MQRFKSAENLKSNHYHLWGVFLQFLSKTLSGETLCKFLQIFPPKVLVYKEENFSKYLLNYLISYNK